jgi:hypothetical protein
MPLVSIQRHIGKDNQEHTEHSWTCKITWLNKNRAQSRKDTCKNGSSWFKQTTSMPCNLALSHWCNPCPYVPMQLLLITVHPAFYLAAPWWSCPNCSRISPERLQTKKKGMLPEYWQTMKAPLRWRQNFPTVLVHRLKSWP